MSFSKSTLMPQGLASRRFVVNELAFSLSFYCCTTPPPHTTPYITPTTPLSTQFSFTANTGNFI